jgi:polar amino acid transport system substrate-binding protein
MPTLLPETTRAALAPQGVLRATINLGNPVLARRAAPEAPPTGVSVDLAQALADELGLPLRCQVVEAAARSVEAVRDGQADLGFFAVDPLRGAGIAFSAPYLLIEGAYLVRADAPLQDNAQVDRAGVRVVVGQGSAYDLYLTRALAQAQILRAPSPGAVLERFLESGAEVAAGIRPQLVEQAARHAGLRVLPGHFMVIEQAMGLPAARGAAAAAALHDFVERAKAGGLLAQALARHRVQGALIAPPAA